MEEKKKKNLLEEKERKKGKKEKVKNITKIAIIPGAHYLYEYHTRTYTCTYHIYFLRLCTSSPSCMYTVCNKDDSSPGFSVGKQLKKEVALIIAYLAKKLLS